MQMRWLDLKIGSGGGYMEQQQMLEPEPANLWVSPAMIGLYGTVVMALVAPVVVLWLKHRWKCRRPISGD